MTCANSTSCLCPLSATKTPSYAGLSGMDAVFGKVEGWRADAGAQKCREWCRLTDKVLVELSDRQRDIQSELSEARCRLNDLQRRLQGNVATFVQDL